MADSIIRTFLASLGDLDKAQRLVDPEAKFIAVREKPDSSLPLYGTFIGHDGLKVFTDGLRSAFDTQMFKVDTVLENNKIGFASGRFEHRIRATDAMFRSHWALMCEFKDGRISLYRFFEDTAALEEATGIRTQCKETVAG